MSIINSENELGRIVFPILPNLLILGPLLSKAWSTKLEFPDAPAHRDTNNPTLLASVENVPAEELSFISEA